jgi:hypothetical protein
MSLKKEVQVTIKISGTSPIDLNKKIKLLEKLSRLDFDDQDRIFQIIDNNNALKGLAENWPMLKQMFA